MKIRFLIPAGLLLAPILAASLTAEQTRSDLQLVRDQYLAKDLAFNPATRLQAEALLEALDRKADRLTPAELTVGLAQVGALADNAHSGLRLRDARVKPTASLPLHLLWMPDALIVARSTLAYADLAGARVLKIEGRSPLALYEGAKVLLGGSDAGREHWLNERLEAGGILHALGLAASADHLAMTLQLVSGATVERDIPMIASEQLTPGVELERLWSPEAGAEERGWVSALSTVGLPLYLKDGNRPFRSLAPGHANAWYVQFRSNEDETGYPIAGFLETVTKDIAAHAPRHLIIDLRFDVGGNITTTMNFMRDIAHSVPGRTYVLIGRYTFSAGIISAAGIKVGGGSRVTLVGDEVGDRLHFWSEGDFITLPNTHYSFRYTDGQFNLRDGCSGEVRCMDDLYHVNVNVPLTPDIHAPLTAEAYFAKRDPGLEAVMRDIRSRDKVRR